MARVFPPEAKQRAEKLVADLKTALRARIGRLDWMADATKQAAYAKLDTLMVEALANACSEAEIDAAVDAYVSIGSLFDGGVKQQAVFDLTALEQATGRMLSAREREIFLAQQHQAQRWTYLGSGMTHQNFLSTLGQMRPAGRERVAQIARAFC